MPRKKPKTMVEMAREALAKRGFAAPTRAEAACVEAADKEPADPAPKGGPTIH